MSIDQLITIALIDERASTRYAMRRLLACTVDLTVIADCANLHELRPFLPTQSPNIAIFRGGG